MGELASVGSPRRCVVTGLVKDYYSYRAKLVLAEALAAAAAGKPLDTGVVNTIKADHACEWAMAVLSMPFGLFQ